jgi:predicted GNAT family N-acyltransferase
LTDQPEYIVKPLEDEDRAAFQCGNEELDKYFHERASRDMRNKLAAIFIMVAKDDPKTIIGFFTLSSQQVRCDNLPQDIQKKTGRYTVVGATLLGRMAIAKQFQGQKHGRRLLFAALYEAWKATHHVMSFAVVVDAKSADVIPFYEKYGFRKLEGNRLIMMMKTIEQTFIKDTASPSSAASSQKAGAATPAAD